MPYTEACLREIMRIDALVPIGVPHRAMKDIKFHGYDIPEVQYTIIFTQTNKYACI